MAKCVNSFRHFSTKNYALRLNIVEKSTKCPSTLKTNNSREGGGAGGCPNISFLTQ